MDRPLPQNLEAEKCVLGAILLAPSTFDSVADVLGVGDFMDNRHRKVFACMQWVRASEKPIDFITLQSALEWMEWLEVVGVGYLVGLVDGVPRSVHAEHYARIVKEKATLRNLIRSAEAIVAKAYADDASSSCGDACAGESHDA